MKKILKEFKDFALKGNMIDMAVGIIIGGAFNGLVGSIVNDVVMPLLSVFMGKLDYSNLFFALNGEHYATLQAAKDANAATVNYGLFITQLINFLIMAFVVFMVVKQINRLKTALVHEPEMSVEPAEPTEKDCPFCKSKIDIHATRCPHCTSELTE